MHAQQRRGNRPPRKQNADRFKGDLMFRLKETVSVEGLHELLPFLTSGRLIAIPAEGPEFVCDLRFAIH
jgi:hypothetical protein